MRVSVTMPVYNAGPYLREAIESILNQTFTDFEFIAINDGSTDDSNAILEEYAQRDTRLRTVSRPNRGITATRNEALELARGEFVAVMDADDISVPERFSLQVQYLDTHPDCLAVGGRILLIDPEGMPIRETCGSQTHEEIDVSHMLGRGGALAHPASMMRREAIDAVGGYREQLGAAEDLDLFLRLAEHGHLANVPQIVLKYRQHSDSVSHLRADVTLRCTEEALRDAYMRRQLTMPPELRPVVDLFPLAPAAHHRKWAWWALNEGNVSTARKHAFAALRLEPFDRDSWKAALSALRGH